MLLSLKPGIKCSYNKHETRHTKPETQNSSRGIKFPLLADSHLIIYAFKPA